MMPTWLVALVAGGATIWAQIKNALQWIISIVLVTVTINDYYSFNLIPYLNYKYKKLPIGHRSFRFARQYIKSKKTYQQVAFEAPGIKSVYMNGIFPIFLSNEREDKSIQDTYGILKKLSFIRGTVNIEKLLSNAAEFTYQLFDSKPSKEVRPRYRAYKKHGSLNRKKDYGTASPKQVEQDEADIHVLNPIGYSKQEIGLPSSNDPYSNLFYPNEIIESIKDIKIWRKSKDWYKEHFLNWRYGVCLHGPPGTGKTSFVRALAQELDLPIYIFDLSTMDNNDFNNAWSESLMDTPCVVLLEDFDRQVQSDCDKGSDFEKPVTLDCLLNCISGIEPADGILLAITCNDITKLDSALGIPQDGQSTRPGRIDKILYFGILDESARIQMASRILSDCPEFIPSLVKEGEGDTGAQFQFRCSSVALKCYWSKDSISVT